MAQNENQGKGSKLNYIQHVKKKLKKTHGDLNIKYEVQPSPKVSLAKLKTCLFFIIVEFFTFRNFKSF